MRSTFFIILAFAYSEWHISALRSDAKGQLQGLSTAEDVWVVDCTWNGTYTQTPLGLRSTGANARRQLGHRELASNVPSGAVHFPTEARVLDFACRSEHVLAVVESHDDEHRAARVGRVWNKLDSRV
jgi:hypothetical protein